MRGSLMLCLAACLFATAWTEDGPSEPRPESASEARPAPRLDLDLGGWLAAAPPAPTPAPPPAPPPEVEPPPKVDEPPAATPWPMDFRARLMLELDIEKNVFPSSDFSAWAPKLNLGYSIAPFERWSFGASLTLPLLPHTDSTKTQEGDYYKFELSRAYLDLRAAYRVTESGSVTAFVGPKVNYAEYLLIFKPNTMDPVSYESEDIMLGVALVAGISYQRVFMQGEGIFVAGISASYGRLQNTSAKIAGTSIELGQDLYINPEIEVRYRISEKHVVTGGYRNELWLGGGGLSGMSHVIFAGYSYSF